jgi:hypothetical protein
MGLCGQNTKHRRHLRLRASPDPEAEPTELEIAGQRGGKLLILVIFKRIFISRRALAVSEAGESGEWAILRNSNVIAEHDLALRVC